MVQEYRIVVMTDMKILIINTEEKSEFEYLLVI
jgi:hypothetical protein